jgi:hypothetical protein
MGISVLRPAELVALDYDQLEHIWRRLGPHAGELAIGAAMEELAALLDETEACWRACDLPGLVAAAAATQDCALRLGMPLVRRVATDVLALSHRQDDLGLAATVARLRRVGEESLCRIWDSQVPV